MDATRATRSHARLDDSERLVRPWDSAARIKIGQCQRYSEYEIRPSCRNGLRPRSFSAPRLGAAAPPAMTIAAPTTGIATSSPG